MKGWIRLSSIHAPSVKGCPDVRAWRVLSSYSLAMTPLSRQAPQKTAEGSVPHSNLSKRPSGETEEISHWSDREGYTRDPCQPAEGSDIPPGTGSDRSERSSKARSARGNSSIVKREPFVRWRGAAGVLVETAVWYIEGYMWHRCSFSRQSSLSCVR